MASSKSGFTRELFMEHHTARAIRAFFANIGENTPEFVDTSKKIFGEVAGLFIGNDR
jgi:hypothetical protein